MFNMTMLQGNLTSNIEKKQSQTGEFYISGIAVNKMVKRPNGEIVKKTLFMNLSFSKNFGEVLVSKYKKGSPALVQGELVMSEYVSKTGEKRRAYSIFVKNIFPLGFSRGKNGEYEAGSEGQLNEKNQDEKRDEENGIPLENIMNSFEEDMGDGIDYSLGT